MTLYVFVLPKRREAIWFWHLMEGFWHHLLLLPWRKGISCMRRTIGIPTSRQDQGINLSLPDSNPAVNRPDIWVVLAFSEARETWLRLEGARGSSWNLTLKLTAGLIPNIYVRSWLQTLGTPRFCGFVSHLVKWCRCEIRIACSSSNWCSILIYLEREWHQSKAAIDMTVVLMADRIGCVLYGHAQDAKE